MNKFPDMIEECYQVIKMLLKMLKASKKIIDNRVAKNLATNRFTKVITVSYCQPIKLILYRVAHCQKSSDEQVRHQVYELPILKLNITEYQLRQACCDSCPRKHVASLPDGECCYASTRG